MAKLLQENGSVVLLEDGFAILLDAVPASALLQQNASRILQEDGFLILLETSGGQGGRRRINIRHIKPSISEEENPSVRIW